jgi:hypothetical protein
VRRYRSHPLHALCKQPDNTSGATKESGRSDARQRSGILVSVTLPKASNAVLLSAAARVELAEEQRQEGPEDAPAWLARTRVEWARMFFSRRRPGDAERARELLGQAVATARERRLANIERRAVHLLT